MCVQLLVIEEGDRAQLGSRLKGGLQRGERQTLTPALSQGERGKIGPARNWWFFDKLVAGVRGGGAWESVRADRTETAAGDTGGVSNRRSHTPPRVWASAAGKWARETGTRAACGYGDAI